MKRTIGQRISAMCVMPAREMVVAIFSGRDARFELERHIVRDAAPPWLAR